MYIHVYVHVQRHTSLLVGGAAFKDMKNWGSRGLIETTCISTYNLGPLNLDCVNEAYQYKYVP